MRWSVLDLFSGIGGFSLGLERAGMETVAFCEINPYCQGVLRQHWPRVPIYDNIKSITFPNLYADRIWRPDVICGGFPCQPYSRAGHRKAAADTRDLLPEFLRVVREFEPQWVVGENTEGFSDLGLDAMCDELENYGYSTTPLDLPACAFGLSTMERHLWIVATASSKRLERFREITIQAIENGAQEFQGSNPRGADRWHLPSARVCGMGERIPRRLDRLRALGNAVSPQTTEIIGRAIMEASA